VQGLERERDFYFSKLRDIELLVQGAMDADPELDTQEDSLLKQIQTILYSTEVWAVRVWSVENRLTRPQEGFEIPAEAEGEFAEGEEGADGEYAAAGEEEEEGAEETF
jgi:RP/EB family microtubule-associated protein